VVCLVGVIAAAVEAHALRLLDIRRAGTAAVLDKVREAEARQTLLAAELAESERRTRAVLESALDAVAELDEDGVITAWNPAAERLFGWPASEAVGSRLDSPSCRATPRPDARPSASWRTSTGSSTSSPRSRPTTCGSR
jgi:PAS domain-containing protein